MMSGKVSAFVAYQAAVKAAEEAKKSSQVNGGAAKRAAESSEEMGGKKARRKRRKRSKQARSEAAADASAAGAPGAPAQPPAIRNRSSPKQPSRHSDSLPPAKISSESPDALFARLIAPSSSAQFFATYWEKQPLVVRRNDANYYSEWFSTSEFDRLLALEKLKFTENIDVTRYENDTRETVSLEGVAYRSVVWKHYGEGCSIRLLNPQTFSTAVWKKLCELQEFFQCGMGANVYLTPPGTQGFAPHYDDIEAFVLQLEGEKNWRVYRPFANEELPLYSSENLRQTQLTDAPTIECCLKAGDLLYFPRGWIHQAYASSSVHSLHITVSTYQLNSISCALEHVLQLSLAKAITSDLLFRQGLPRNYLNYMGLQRDQLQRASHNDRNKLVSLVKSLVHRLSDRYIDETVDQAFDMCGVKFIHDSLPPFIDAELRKRTIHSSLTRWDNATMTPVNVRQLTASDQIALVSRFCVYLCFEAKEFRLYYSTENDRVYHAVERRYLVLDKLMARSVRRLIGLYPAFVSIEHIPPKAVDIADKLNLANELYSRGIVQYKPNE